MTCTPAAPGDDAATAVVFVVGVFCWLSLVHKQSAGSLVSHSICCLMRLAWSGGGRPLPFNRESPLLLILASVSVNNNLIQIVVSAWQTLWPR